MPFQYDSKFVPDNYRMHDVRTFITLVKIRKIKESNV